MTYRRNHLLQKRPDRHAGPCPVVAIDCEDVGAEPARGQAYVASANISGGDGHAHIRAQDRDRSDRTRQILVALLEKTEVLQAVPLWPL